jgi:hypothetical protein
VVSVTLCAVSMSIATTTTTTNNKLIETNGLEEDVSVVVVVLFRNCDRQRWLLSSTVTKDSREFILHLPLANTNAKSAVAFCVKTFF